MKKAFLLLVAFLVSPALPAEPPAPIFRLFMAKEAALALIPNAPTVRRTKIAESLAGRLLSGLAFTNGRTHVELVPSENDARIRLVMDFTTSARTITERTVYPEELAGSGNPVPPNKIDVDVYATALTQTHLTKVIVFYPDHLESLPAEATSRTAVTIHGATARTSGAFAGQVRKQAEARAINAARLAVRTKEEETAERMRTEILGQVEGKSGPMLKDLNRDYKTIFYDPLFTDNRIPGRPHYYTAEDGLRVVVEAPTPWGAVAKLPTLHPDTLVGMNLHDSLLNGKIAPRLNGKVYDEYELEGFLLRQGMVSDPHQWGGVPDRTYIRFCDADSMHFIFAHNEVDLSVCVKAVKVATGPWEGGATMHMVYKLEQPQADTVELTRGPIEVKALENAPAPISAATLDRFEQRYSLIFPAGQEAGGLPIPTSAAILQDLSLDHASIEDGWFNMEWRDGSKNVPAAK